MIIKEKRLRKRLPPKEAVKGVGCDPIQGLEAIARSDAMIEGDLTCNESPGYRLLG